MAASRPVWPRSSATCRRAFLAALATSFPNAAVTVDWFHVVQLFTTAVDQVRKAEAAQPAAPQGHPLGRPQGRRRQPHRRPARSRSPSWKPPLSPPPPPSAPRRCCAGSAKPIARKPRDGASPASSTTSARPAPTAARSRPPALEPSPTTPSASFSAGGHPTPTPASKL